MRIGIRSLDALDAYLMDHESPEALRYLIGPDKYARSKPDLLEDAIRVADDPQSIGYKQVERAIQADRIEPSLTPRFRAEYKDGCAI
jgi:hypothetical protein